MTRFYIFSETSFFSSAGPRSVFLQQIEPVLVVALAGEVT
jgi:hypothetical protein